MPSVWFWVGLFAIVTGIALAVAADARNHRFRDYDNVGLKEAGYYAAGIGGVLTLSALFAQA